MMNATHLPRNSLIVVIMLVVAAAAGFVYWQNVRGNDSDIAEILNYADCVKSQGSVLQLSYPETCVSKKGERFTNPDQNVTMPSPANPRN